LFLVVPQNEDRHTAGFRCYDDSKGKFFRCVYPLVHRMLLFPTFPVLSVLWLNCFPRKSVYQQAESFFLESLAPTFSCAHIYILRSNFSPINTPLVSEVSSGAQAACTTPESIPSLLSDAFPFSRGKFFFWGTIKGLRAKSLLFAPSLLPPAF